MDGLDREAVNCHDIRFSYSGNLPELLVTLRISLLISSYHTGHVIVVTGKRGELKLSFHQFKRASGLAYKPGCIAVCSDKEVWFARSVPDVVAKLEPHGYYDACFLARTMHFTGDIRAHESAWVGSEFWIVNTLFSCICALHPIYSFSPRWRPPFISAMAPEDRCHLNGMAVADGQPKYVTAVAETDTAEGWRKFRDKSGCIMEVPSGRIVARGLSTPHSPRVQGDRLYFLNSGHGRMEVLEISTGKIDTVVNLQGLTRGLTLYGGLAFVGTSKARPTWTEFPLVQRGEKLKCGLAVVDLKTGSQVAHLDFDTGISEVFDVVVLPGITSPYFSGPRPESDGSQPMWTIPPA